MLIQAESVKEREDFKVYKQRWLILFASFCILFVVGLHKSLISIADIVEEHMEITLDQYAISTQISMYISVVSMLSMARLLDRIGLRRFAYVASTMIVLVNGLKALCCADEMYVPVWVKDHRYAFLLLSEVFVGLIQSIAIGFPAKVAGTWFPHRESTLALVVANSGYNIGVGASNYLLSIVVQTGADMYKVSYLFLITGALVAFAILACITRSTPKMPPSSNAILSAATQVPLKDGLMIMLSNPSYVLVVLTWTLNIGSLTATQLLLENILKVQHYSNSFCGTLIAHSYIFGTFFMLMGAAWIDNSVNYIRVSRVASMLCAVSFVCFNVSIILPNIEGVILVTNTLAAFGCSLMDPACTQVSIRSAITILPEATVSATNNLLLQIVTVLLMNLFGPLKRLSDETNPYQAPMIVFACLVMVVNMLYVTSFRAPRREELQRKLQAIQRDRLYPGAV